MADDDSDYTNDYNTPLSSRDEMRFQEWLAEQSEPGNSIVLPGNTIATQGYR